MTEYLQLTILYVMLVYEPYTQYYNIHIYAYYVVTHKQNTAHVYLMVKDLNFIDF